jgi:hypothetical protein
MNMQSEQTRKTLKSAETFFSRWAGAPARVREVTSSLQTLKLLVQREFGGPNLLVSCIEPMWMRGPFRWNDCRLQASVVEGPESAEVTFRVYDLGADFEVVCGKIEVFENVKL